MFVAYGKTKAARRKLPMAPAVYAALRELYMSRGEVEALIPEENLGRKDQPPLPRPRPQGWVFPAGSRSGHIEQGSLKNAHRDALRQLQLAHATWKQHQRERDWVQAVADGAKLDLAFVRAHAEVIRAGVEPFQVYCLRHTALTRMAPFCDAFTLARIAGHSTIAMVPTTTTNKYVV